MRKLIVDLINRIILNKFSSMTLGKSEIASIFKRTKKLYPQLMIDMSTGQDYTIDHPAAESIAMIMKIKLDELDHIVNQIEEGKKKCLSTMGYTSVQDMYNQRHVETTCASTPRNKKHK